MLYSAADLNWELDELFAVPDSSDYVKTSLQNDPILQKTQFESTAE